MIAIIDYGMGNLRSVQKGLERAGFEALVTRGVGEIHSARGVVLPGVGAFSACMENLGKFGLIEPIREIVREHKPFLGICLGFQLLFSESEEFGKQKGLELFSGKVVGFHASGELKVPHMAGTELKRSKTRRFSKAFRRATMFTSSTLFTSCRRTARSSRPPPITASRLSPASRPTECSPANSTRKRARSWVYAFLPILGGSSSKTKARENAKCRMQSAECKMKSRDSQSTSSILHSAFCNLQCSLTYFHADHSRHRSQRRPLRASVSG